VGIAKVKDLHQIILVAKAVAHEVSIRVASSARKNVDCEIFRAWFIFGLLHSKVKRMRKI
jgi:hypothetical protein